jgi:hypothetical protein
MWAIFNPGWLGCCLISQAAKAKQPRSSSQDRIAAFPLWQMRNVDAIFWEERENGRITIVASC